MTTIARVRELYRFFTTGKEKLPVLRGLSLDVAEGEFLCVMGPSGSGKSTLLNILSGLDRPSGGSIVLAGTDLSELSERGRTLLRRRTIGFVFQFFNLMPNLTVMENVMLPLSIEGRDGRSERERLRGLLEDLGLPGREDALPHQLSGGEMQRVSIARALAAEQPLLLCDEPTGNLSQKAGLEVMQILRRLCDEQGRSVLLVTHNPRDACFADRLQFLIDGEIAKDAELRGPNIPVDSVHEILSSLAI